MNKKFFTMINLTAFILIGLAGTYKAKGSYPPPMSPPSQKEIQDAQEKCESKSPDCSLFELWSIPAYEACSLQHCEEAMSLLKQALDAKSSP
jgi:hypothetical protein